jgi:heme exporter protein B
MVWSILLFAGVLGLHRSFGAEVDRGSLAALLLAPVDRSAIYFGKVIANLVFMLTAQLLVLPVVLILFDVNLFRPWILVALLLGMTGYVSVGTLFAALTAHGRARETMLPILLLPVMVPLFLAGVGLTADVLTGESNWLGMLAAYDLLFTTIAFMVFDLIWSEG